MIGRSILPRALVATALMFTVGGSRTALAATPAEAAAPAEPTPVPPDAITIGERAVNPSGTQTTLPEPLPEAPPPPPRRKGVVVEGGLGALGFLGDFRQVAPTAPWFHVQAGYEFLKWLMLFGEGDLAFTDTSETSGPSDTYGFPIFGLGAGARFTVHPTNRFAVYLQGAIDGMKADVPAGALRNLGFKNAESFNPSFGARLGVEWYQVDRHLALGLALGIRDATGFAKVIGSSDAGLMADASAVLRYTF